jgi:hypothetical protein
MKFRCYRVTGVLLFTGLAVALKAQDGNKDGRKEKESIKRAIR